MADRVGSKTVLSLSASLFLLVILGWTFTTHPDRYFLTVPLLVILHIFAGIATAGVTLTVRTLALKVAPPARRVGLCGDRRHSCQRGLRYRSNPWRPDGRLFLDPIPARRLDLDLYWQLGPTACHHSCGLRFSVRYRFCTRTAFAQPPRRVARGGRSLPRRLR